MIEDRLAIALSATERGFTAIFAKNKFEVDVLSASDNTLIRNLSLVTIATVTMILSFCGLMMKRLTLSSVIILPL